MMQIVKHNKEPMSAIMRSKDGKTMAIKTIRTSTNTRIRALPIVTAFPDASVLFREAGSRPHRTSAVAMSGRALKCQFPYLKFSSGRHSLQRHLCDGDYCSKQNHANRKGARIACALQYIDYNFITDSLPKHQPANYSHGAIKGKLDNQR